MESAGVAEAAHHNDFHRVVSVRAVSDLADGTKGATDAAGWQRRAVRHAAAFATALAERIAAAPAADELARQGAGAVVGAMATSAFPAVRVGVARLFRRLEREDTARTQLDADNTLVTEAGDAVREALAQGWRHRLAQLLQDDPGAARELRGLLVVMPPEPARWVQTVVARDNSTVYAVQGGQIIRYETPPPGG